MSDVAPVPRDMVICPTCHADEFDRWAEGRVMVRCRRCGLGIETHLSSDPASAYGRRKYDEVRHFDRSSAWARFHHDVAVAEARLRQLADHLPRPEGTWLDIGSNTGAFLVQARRRGWDVAGVELDIEFCREASAVVGVPMWPYQSWASSVEAASQQKASEQAAAAPRVVSLFDVLEHTYDPTYVVHLATRTVSHGGRVVIEVPDLDECPTPDSFLTWKHRKIFDGFTEHVWHFNERALTRMFDVYGGLGAVQHVGRPLPGRLQFVWARK